MITIQKLTVTVLIVLAEIISLTPMVVAQDQEDIVYKVEHKHAIGVGRGELHITKDGIKYSGESQNEPSHSRSWQDLDIKRLEINKKELRIVIYEESHLPIIPRKAPFTDGKSIKIDTEHDYLFRLQDGEITEELAKTLLERFQRPIASSIIPEKLRETSELIFEIPVFHRHLRGGASGVLRIYGEFIIFDTGVEKGSRYWRYSDIRDIARLGQYKFELATYEGQMATDGKSYIFDLKRPMTDKEYDSLWKKVY